jgi:hypothetical protein
MFRTHLIEINGSSYVEPLVLRRKVNSEDKKWDERNSANQVFQYSFFILRTQ